MKFLKSLSYVVLISLLTISCRNLDVYEKTVAFPNQKWLYQFKPEFKFSISDTRSAYNIFLVVRHTDAYKYNNLWLKADITPPGDSTKTQNIDLTLATDQSGWEGKGMDDIFEYRKNITPGPVPFKKPGEYKITLSQIMRENPLDHLMNVGVRIEKVKLN